MYFCVTYDSQNKQWLFRQTELTGWFLYWRLTVIGEVRTELFHVLKYCSQCLIQNIMLCFTPLYKAKRNFSTINFLLVLLNGWDTLLCVCHETLCCVCVINPLNSTYIVPCPEAITILVCVFFFRAFISVEVFCRLLTW